MSSMSLPLRLAGLAVILSVASASAADDVVSRDVVAKDSAPAVIAAQPAADRPVATTAAEEVSATDLGAARAAAVKRVAAPAPGVFRRRPPQHTRLACSGIWCGRQFVLMLGTAF